MDKRFSVSISAGTIITALLIITGAYTLWILRSLILLIITAIVIASAIEPGVGFFVRRKIPRVLAVLFMYIVVIGSFFGIVFFFFPPILADVQSFLITIPQYLNTLNIPSLSATGQAPSQAQSIIQTVETFQSAFTTGYAGTFQLIATFFGGIFSFFLVLVLSFYFAVQDTGVEDFLRIVVPASKEDYAVNLWLRAKQKIGLWMQGQILLSAIIGILVYLGLLIMGIPYALLLAVFTAMAELVPIFGSLIAGAAAAVVGYTTGGIALGFIVAGLYVVVNQFETNLIYPLVVKKVVGIPPLLVILALIAGGELAGFLGVLLSVPVAAAALEFISDLDRIKRGNKVQ